MNKIIFITGRSGSGKNTFANELFKDGRFKEVDMHTTRPRRYENETGYVFETKESYFAQESDGLVLESRCYHTVKGDWYYWTNVSDILEIVNSNFYPVIPSGTPEMYRAIKPYCDKLGIEIIVFYMNIDKSVILDRAVAREKKNDNPNFEELCRRFLADSNDYSEENTSIYPEYARDKIEVLPSAILVKNFLIKHNL